MKENRWVTYIYIYTYNIFIHKVKLPTCPFFELLLIILVCSALVTLSE